MLMRRPLAISITLALSVIASEMIWPDSVDQKFKGLFGN
jgi:hypothetical protein